MPTGRIVSAHVSGRYKPGIEYDPAFRQSTEIRIGRNGDLRMNGWPTT